MGTRIRMLVAIVGALVFGTAGAVVGAANAGWIDSGQEGNALLPFLGVGTGLVVVAFWGTPFATELTKSGIGKAAAILIALSSVMYVISWLIEFAIFGTLTLFAGLVCLTIAAFAHRLGALPERILIALSAVGSITWNTETSSALLLAGVAVIWIVLSVRLLDSQER